jgi:hypothetical protein
MATTSDIPLCPTCGGGMYGIRVWCDGARPLCLVCHGSSVHRVGGWKQAAAANHRTTLHRIATAEDMPPRRAVVLIAKRSLPPARALPADETGPSCPPVPSLRDRLRARRRDIGLTPSGSPTSEEGKEATDGD